MAIKAIAYSYWRRIKAGSRTYDSTPASVKEDVKTLAMMDVEDHVITREEYANLIGEEYPVPVVEEVETPVEETTPTEE